MRRALLLLIVVPGALSNLVGRLPGEQTRSVHHEHQRTSGGIRDLGYFRSPQVYADAQFTSHGRRTSATSFSRMRLNIEYTSTSALTTEKETFFRDKLIPDAKAWIENAFSVVPISGPLLVDRFCSSSFSSGMCASVSGIHPTCGLNADGTYYTIPDSMLAAKRTCGGSPTTGCTDHPAGAGAADTDFLLYVAAVQTSSCGTGDAGTLAYASTCERDQNDRPVLGYANFCPAMMDTSGAAYKGQLATAVQALGCGELLLNCIDNDGQNDGYDLQLTRSVREAVTIPVIASSGAGCPAHFTEVFNVAGAEAPKGAGGGGRRGEARQDSGRRG